MRSSAIAQQSFEKAAAGWIRGQNSTRTSWLMEDTQYKWAVNAVNRGGIVQCRPGRRLRLIFPPGNFQGVFGFRVTKLTSPNFNRSYVIGAVNGVVYAVPFNSDGTLPFNNVPDWSIYRLANIQFDNNAKQVFWASPEKSLAASSSTELTIVGTYSVLMMQDGVSDPAYWDGDTSGHLDPDQNQTPIGTWMTAAGSRLWVAQDNLVAASDLADPLSFNETFIGEARGKFKFTRPVTGLVNSVGGDRQGNVVVFTEENTSSLLASILDRELWATTAGFQTVIFPSTGCIAGRSPAFQNGLLWWYSPDGLVNSDSAAAAFLTSKINVKDIEMAQSKMNFAPDLTGIAATAFESYLLVSVPSGDTLNAHTMVLDTAIADELGSTIAPAWNSVWTGARPIEWISIIVNGQKRCFGGSIDYQTVNGQSFNTLWEEFQPDRNDVYEYLDASNSVQTFKNKIYWSFETKLMGDGLDLKRFKYAEAQVVNMSGETQLKVSFRGTTGPYISVFNKKFISVVDPNLYSSQAVRNLYDLLGYFKPQSRYIRTQEPSFDLTNAVQVESNNTPDIDRRFSLYFQGCGPGGIESLRMFMEAYPDPSTGGVETDEETLNVVSIDGTQYQFPNT